MSDTTILIDDVVLSNAESLMRTCGGERAVVYLKSRDDGRDWKECISRSIREVRRLIHDDIQAQKDKNALTMEEDNHLTDHRVYLEWRRGVLRKLQTALG